MGGGMGMGIVRSDFIGGGGGWRCLDWCWKEPWSATGKLRVFRQSLGSAVVMVGDSARR